MRYRVRRREKECVRFAYSLNNWQVKMKEGTQHYQGLSDTPFRVGNWQSALGSEIHFEWTSYHDDILKCDFSEKDTGQYS